MAKPSDTKDPYGENPEHHFAYNLISEALERLFDKSLSPESLVLVKRLINLQVKTISSLVTLTEAFQKFDKHFDAEVKINKFLSRCLRHVERDTKLVIVPRKKPLRRKKGSIGGNKDPAATKSRVNKARRNASSLPGPLPKGHKSPKSPRAVKSPKSPAARRRRRKPRSAKSPKSPKSPVPDHKVMSPLSEPDDSTPDNHASAFSTLVKEHQTLQDMLSKGEELFEPAPEMDFEDSESEGPEELLAAGGGGGGTGTGYVDELDTDAMVDAEYDLNDTLEDMQASDDVAPSSASPPKRKSSDSASASAAPSSAPKADDKDHKDSPQVSRKGSPHGSRSSSKGKSSRRKRSSKPANDDNKDDAHEITDDPNVTVPHGPQLKSRQRALSRTSLQGRLERAKERQNKLELERKKSIKAKQQERARRAKEVEHRRRRREREKEQRLHMKRSVSLGDNIKSSRQSSRQPSRAGSVIDANEADSPYDFTDDVSPVVSSVSQQSARRSRAKSVPRKVYMQRRKQQGQIKGRDLKWRAGVY